MAKKCYAGEGYGIQRFIVDLIISYLFALVFIIPVLNVYFLRSIIGIRSDIDNEIKSFNEMKAKLKKKNRRKKRRK